MEIVDVGDFNRITAVDIFATELDKLFSKSQKDKNRFYEFLNAELHKIDNRTETANREEPIKYKDIKLYSIRKKMKKNTRVLYYCKKDDTILLLTAFDEKNKHDYENGKERAYNRLKELKID